MAINVGNVVVTVTLDDSLRARIVNTLERAKHEHYEDRSEGLNTCPKIYPQGDYKECDCGADSINAEIDELIAELRKPPNPTRDVVNQDRLGREML